MKLKYLYILALTLCMGSVANSNECSRHCPNTTAHCTRAAAGKPSDTGSVTASHPKAGIRPRSTPTAAPREVSDYTPTPLIRLLYI